jgi:ribose transport system ATP-binding protein
MRHIAKSFGTVKALKRVDLDIHAGEVHALMGENGAGKSTLMKVLSGAYRPDPGAEFFQSGQPVSITKPQDARDLGIAIIYQELSLAPNLTVAENIALGNEPRHAGLVDRGAMRGRAAGILKRLGVSFGPDMLVSSLSIAQMQMVEIARALSAEAGLIVMDEPTTALSTRETETLFSLIRQLREEGLAIVYISHRMAEIYDLADRCSVLRDGRYIGTLMREELSASRLVTMMVGRDVGDFYKHSHSAEAIGAEVLRVEGITDGRKVTPCSLSIRSGEVVGLAGLVGAGRTELARLVYGAERPTSGSVFVNDERRTIAEPGDALDAGIVYLTEDRQGQGLFLDMTINDNVNIGVMGRDARFAGMRSFAKGKARAGAAMKALAIRAPTIATDVGGLSGGNQQKVLIARLLETAPRVLILDEPTRGVDIGAKSEIYKLINQLAKSGAAILLISSELPEIVGLSDRVLVMREGAVVSEIRERKDITQEAIIASATGSSEDTFA